MIQFVLVLCGTMGSLGFLLVVWVLSWHLARRLLLTIGGRYNTNAAPPQPSIGCLKVHNWMSKPHPPRESSSVLTGQELVDVHLKQALKYGMRDFVQSWFHVLVSPNPMFPGEVEKAVVAVIGELTTRCSEADLATLLSQTLLEAAVDHLSRCKETALPTAAATPTATPTSTATTDKNTEGGLAGRVLSGLSEDDPWIGVCLQTDTQRAYFQGVSELLLLIVLPSSDFANPSLRLLIRDLLTQQVWIPLVQLLSDPDYINSTLISLCKEQSLNSESFLSAIRNPHSLTEIERVQEFVATETNRLKARGVSGTDKERLASLDVVMTTIEKQLEGEVEEGSEDFDTALPLSLSVTVPEFVVDRGSNVMYSLNVSCRHTDLDMTESWNTQRAFSDFHDFHMTLRNTLGFLPSSLTLPSRRAIKKLDPTFLETRRRGLEVYLQTLVSESLLSRHPQVLGIISMFLSHEYYRRSSNELNRQMDRLFHPFKKMPSLTSKLTNSTTVAYKVSSSSSPLLSQRKQPNTMSQDSNSTTTEEDEQELDLLLRLLDELFDLRDHRQWLRRQLAHILSQLLDDRVSRKVAEGVAWLTSTEQISNHCKSLLNAIWPGGIRPGRHGNREEDLLGGVEAAAGDGEEEEEERVKMLRAVLVRTKLIGSVPDELRRLLGTRRTTLGLSRLSHLLQDPSLNCWLCLRVFEAVLQTLFPSHSLGPAFRLLRQQLHNTATQRF